MRRTLSAQSSRELPATEMAVNPFHHAGVSSKNVTSSVPHLKEIIDVATSIETPSLFLYLDAVEIWYDPDPSDTIINEDKVFVESIFAIPDKDIKLKVSPQPHARFKT
jgi:DNA-directed RNA polymerase II subunit RPB1